jgi:hypothetical protein
MGVKQIRPCWRTLAPGPLLLALGTIALLQRLSRQPSRRVLSILWAHSLLVATSVNARSSFDANAQVPGQVYSNQSMRVDTCRREWGWVWTGKGMPVVTRLQCPLSSRTTQFFVTTGSELVIASLT